jgi:hypothetical protein
MLRAGRGINIARLYASISFLNPGTLTPRKRPAPLRRARLWRAQPVTRFGETSTNSRFESHNGLKAPHSSLMRSTARHAVTVHSRTRDADAKLDVLSARRAHWHEILDHQLRREAIGEPIERNSI